jgi:hypothetical protein
MAANLTAEDLEKTYDLIAESIDEVGIGQESLFLSKLCLALADRLGDMQEIEASIRLAKSHLGERKTVGPN